MKLNLWGSLSRTGYGVATLNYLLQLEKQGVDVAMLPMGAAHCNTQEEADIVTRAAKRSKMPYIEAPSLKVWHQHDLCTQIGRGKYYAMPIFELTKFKDNELHHLQFPDELIVNSKWAADVIKDQADRDAHIVPLGVDTNVFTPPGPFESDGVYNFLNVGKWEVRKGHDVLVDIFNKAFTKDDNVALNLMPHNPFLKPEESQKWIDKYKNSPLGDKIFLFEEVGPHQDLALVMQQVDCGIFPSRAEGWNLELLEMMACGKPVITTNYSAHTEFCTKDNSYLVDTPDLEDAHDGQWFHGQGQWTKLSTVQIDEMVDHMRYCYNERPSNPTGVETAKEFSWENSTKKLVTTIFG